MGTAKMNNPTPDPAKQLVEVSTEELVRNLRAQKSMYLKTKTGKKTVDLTVDRLTQMQQRIDELEEDLAQAREFKAGAEYNFPDKPMVVLEFDFDNPLATIEKQQQRINEAVEELETPSDFPRQQIGRALSKLKGTEG